MTTYNFTVRATDAAARVATLAQSIVDHIDPYYANVVSLLNFNGANNSTVFTDEMGKTWTAVGAPILETATKKYGTASLRLNGSSALSCPVGTDFDFSGDFTAECWIYYNAAPTARPTFYTADGATGAHVGHFFATNTSGALRAGLAYASSNTSFLDLNGTTVLTTGQFYHLELDKSGSTVKMFLNGTLEASATGVAAIATPKGRSIYLGQYYDGTTRLNGWIDDFRFTKGLARHTASFTPPASQLSL